MNREDEGVDSFCAPARNRARGTAKTKWDDARVFDGEKMPIKRVKRRTEGPTPRERIIEVMRDAKRPIRSLEIWQRLAIEKGQHHPDYLHLSEVRREVRAMYHENKLRQFKSGG